MAPAKSPTTTSPTSPTGLSIALNVLFHYLEPALVVAAAGLWLYVLTVFANHSP
jgi:hypothetical protein